jgi:hypothetical protein
MSAVKSYRRTPSKRQKVQRTSLKTLNFRRIATLSVVDEFMCHDVLGLFSWFSFMDRSV